MRVITHKKAYRKAYAVRLGPQLVDLSLYAALTKKRKILDGSAVVWCAVRLYTPYTFRVMHEGKEEKRRRKNKIKIFAFDFLDCEMK